MVDPKDRKRGGLKKAKPQSSVPKSKEKEEKTPAQQIADAKMDGTYDKWLREYYGLFHWGDARWPNGELIERLRADGVLSEGQVYKDNMSGVKSWLQKRHVEHNRARAPVPLLQGPKIKPKRRI